MRIVHLGAGVLVPLADVNAASVGTAVRAVLTEPAYREAVRRAAGDIAKIHPVADAVRIIEEILAPTFASV
jgi:zeaxanthin glucosyltransferase